MRLSSDPSETRGARRIEVLVPTDSPFGDEDSYWLSQGDSIQALITMKTEATVLRLVLPDAGSPSLQGRARMTLDQGDFAVASLRAEREICTGGAGIR